jgi:hypothetical protein
MDTPALTIPALADHVEEIAHRAINKSTRLEGEDNRTLYGMLSLLWIIANNVIEAGEFSYREEKQLNQIITDLAAAIQSVTNQKAA